jgi:hypothetical protein
VKDLVLGIIVVGVALLQIFWYGRSWIAHFRRDPK